MKKTVIVPILFSIVMPLVAGDDASRYARNWPQWRGPEATGVAPAGDPPTKWSEDRNVRWKVELPGLGLSTPVVWGNRVFLTTAIETDKPADPAVAAAAAAELPDWFKDSALKPETVVQFAVLALDRKDGRVLWQRVLREATPHAGTHPDSSWATNSAVTDGKYLIAHFGSNGTYALDLEGKVKWEIDLGEMSTRRSFGEGSSPAMHGDTVVINWDHEGPSFITALDRDTGKTRWKVERDEPTSWSTPVIVERGGKAQVIVAATGRTRGYDLANGKVIWEAGGMTVNTIPSPVVADGRVYVMSGFRGSALQAIDLSKARGDLGDSAALLWQRDQDTPYVPSPLLYGDRLYYLKVNDNILSCVNARTGEPHYTRQRLEGVAGVYASPVGAAGRVYVVGRRGTTLVFEDAPEFKVLAENKLDDAFDASPSIVDGELYLRGRKHLYCIAEEKQQ